MNPFEADIVQLTPDKLDSFFEGTPQGTPNAENVHIPGANLIDGVIGTNTDNIPFFDADAEDEPVEGAATEEKPLVEEEKPVIIEEEKPAEEEEKPVVEAPSEALINETLKSTLDYLISSGQWADFDGREDLEMTQEVYADLAARQNQHAAYEIVNELVDSTGDYGKAIINHIKKGGNPDEIIDLFKEQKAIQQIDTSTEQGKQVLIEKYYKEVLNWKPEKVEKLVKRLITDDEIESEFTDVKESYDQHNQEKLAEIQQEVVQKEEKNKERQAKFVTDIKSALQEDTSLSDKDRKLISSSILDFRHKLDNGQVVNDFYIKFAEMQADPKKYIQMVKYILDPAGYDKKISVKEATKEAVKSFQFIKGNSTIGKVASNPVSKNTPASETKAGTNFSFALKK